MSELRIGLIGAGRIAQAAHLPALAKAEGACLVAVCDSSPTLSQGVAQRYDVPGYTDVAELLAHDGLDAVIVAVPDRLHLPLASQALRAGKHVLVEKPLAAVVEEAEELAALAEQTGLHLQVGSMKRFDPGIAFAAEAVRDAIGPVLSASIWYRVMSGLRPATEATLFPPTLVDPQVRAHETAMKADRTSYLLTTHGAHVLDEIRFLVGDPVSLSAQLARSGDDRSWHGLARLSGGGLAGFEITASVHAEYAEGADIYGERGHVKLRTHFPFALRASDVEVFDEAAATVRRPVFADANPYERQIEAFARDVRDGRPANPGPMDGVAAVKLIDAVARSAAAEGEQVSL
jgi:predicted dehydrogenase